MEGRDYSLVIFFTLMTVMGKWPAWWVPLLLGILLITARCANVLFPELEQQISLATVICSIAFIYFIDLEIPTIVKVLTVLPMGAGLN